MADRVTVNATTGISPEYLVPPIVSPPDVSLSLFVTVGPGVVRWFDVAAVPNGVRGSGLVTNKFVVDLTVEDV